MLKNKTNIMLEIDAKTLTRYYFKANFIEN